MNKILILPAVAVFIIILSFSIQDARAQPSTLLSVSVDNFTAGGFGPFEPVFTYTETNNGNTVLTDVAVNDLRCSPVLFVKGTGGATPSNLPPGDSLTFQCFTNTNPITLPFSDTAFAVVCTLPLCVTNGKGLLSENTNFTLSAPFCSAGNTFCPTIAFLPAVPFPTGFATVSFNAGSNFSAGAIPEINLPTTGGKPTGVIFPFGFFSYTIAGLTPGQTVNVIMTLPSGLPSNAQYWKVNNGVWTDATSLISISGNVLNLTLTDGGLGDADGLANGVIVDPGGIAIPVSSSPTSVGGIIIPVDVVSLFVAGLATNAFWLLPTLGIVGAVIVLFKRL